MQRSEGVIVGFVEKVTKEGSPDFVPEPERVAGAQACKRED
jgi:hypothetical protein